jgi:[ribosomal protein S5]-alanine N-acetyltransferase
VKWIAQFDTDRLTARRVCWADLEDALRLHADRQVARTLSADGGPLSEETTRRMLRKAILHWRTHGFGLWMFRRRDNGELIGRGGLIRYSAADMGGHEGTSNATCGVGDPGETGLAYIVLSRHWGQGYATEMGRASLAVGFEYLGLDTIGGWTLPSNLASQRILTKLGFRYEKDILFAGRPHRFFRLDRRDYRGV